MSINFDKSSVTASVDQFGFTFEFDGEIKWIDSEINLKLVKMLHVKTGYTFDMSGSDVSVAIRHNSITQYESKLIHAMHKFLLSGAHVLHQDGEKSYQYICTKKLIGQYKFEPFLKQDDVFVFALSDDENLLRVSTEAFFILFATCEKYPHQTVEPLELKEEFTLLQDLDDNSDLPYRRYLLQRDKDDKLFDHFSPFGTMKYEGGVLSARLPLSNPVFKGRTHKERLWKLEGWLNNKDALAKTGEIDKIFDRMTFEIINNLSPNYSLVHKNTIHHDVLATSPYSELQLSFVGYNGNLDIIVKCLGEHCEVRHKQSKANMLISAHDLSKLSEFIEGITNKMTNLLGGLNE